MRVTVVVLVVIEAALVGFVATVAVIVGLLLHSYIVYLIL